MTAAESCVRAGGAIIACAALGDGHGGEAFYRWFADRKDPNAVAKAIQNVPAENTSMDQWEAPDSSTCDAEGALLVRDR